MRNRENPKRKRQTERKQKMSEDGRKLSLTLFLLNEQIHTHTHTHAGPGRAGPENALKNVLRARRQGPREQIIMSGTHTHICV